MDIQGMLRYFKTSVQAFATVMVRNAKTFGSMQDVR